MKLIVGLGNPGIEHKNNRHNAGFMVVEKLAEGDFENKFEAEISRRGETLLVKPQTFMNRSGEAVAKIVSFYKIDMANLFLVHDDLDIRLGDYKIQLGIGPKVHYGLNSVEEKLGGKNFWRIRIGVDNRPVGEARTPGDEYVLADFSDEEKIIVNGVIEKAVKEIVSLL